MDSLDPENPDCPTPEEPRVVEDTSLMLVQVQSLHGGWGTVLVDVRRGVGIGGSIRALRASVDGERISANSITMPVFPDETVSVAFEDASWDNLPLLTCKLIPLR